LIDAAELARRTGVSRTWIYQHAEELGAIKLGEGPKARLRFHPEAIERLRAATRPSEPPMRLRRPQRATRTDSTDLDLLPIKSVRTLLSRSRRCRRKRR
jgi:hypothetical protein